MPTYDYQCDACDHTFEKFQSIKARPIRTCPMCGEKQVRRLIGTGAGVIFKGSGFYQTDYRKSSYNQAAQADKPADKTKNTDTSSDTKSDSSSTKPATGGSTSGAEST